MSTLKVTNIENPDGGGVSAKIADIGGGQLSNRNLIHNGAMKVAQRATSVTGITSASYLADRWIFAPLSLGTWTLEQSTDAPTGFANSFKATCTTADASPAAGDYALILHRTEAQDLQHLAYGTSNAESLVLSFYVKSNKIGAASFDILQHDNSNKQFTKGYTINAANTWEHKKITIPGDTAGVINDDNGMGLIINFWLNSGSTYTGGSHNAAWEVSTTANRNADNLGVGGTNNDYFAITGVQLEIGTNDANTTFEHRTIADDLAICQRYFLKGPAVAIYGQRWSSGNSFVVWNFPVQMRDTPTITGTFNVSTGTLSTNFTDKNMMQQYILNYTAGSLAHNSEFSADL